MKLYARLFYDPLMSLKGVLNLFSFFRVCRAPSDIQDKIKKRNKKQQQLKDMKGPLKVPGPGLHRFVCDWSIFQYDSLPNIKEKKIAKPTKEDFPV